MAETLKSFADANGIGYNLAKQWKRRGRIVTDGDGYRLVTPAERAAVTELVIGRVTLPGVTQPAAAVTSELVPQIAGLLSRLEVSESERAALWQTIERQAETMAALEQRVAELEAAARPLIPMPAHPPTSGRGRADFDWARFDPEHIA